MSDKIAKLYTKESGKDPDAVLEQAVGVYQDVLIVGWDKNGHLEARSSTTLKAKDILWLIEIFKANLINGEYDEVEY